MSEAPGSDPQQHWSGVGGGAPPPGPYGPPYPYGAAGPAGSSQPPDVAAHPFGYPGGGSAPPYRAGQAGPQGRPPGTQYPYGYAPVPPVPPWVNFYPGRAYPSGEPPLGQPYYGISFRNAVRRALHKYARFDGRASLSEYWWWVLARSILGLAIVTGFVLLALVVWLAGLGGTALAYVAVIGLLILSGVNMALFVPGLAIAVRRLHDTNLHGALWLLSFVPSGSTVVLIFTLMPSKSAGVRFDRWE